MTNASTTPRRHSCRVTGGLYVHRSFSHIVHLYLHSTPRFEDRLLPFLFRSLPALFQWFGGLISEFVAHSEAAIRGGPFVPTLQKLEQKWLKVAVTLLNNGFPNEAGELFLRWYQFVRDKEVSYNNRFQKGTVLWWLGRSRDALRSADEAKNWQFLAMLEDVRTNASTWRTLPARDSLVNGLQLAASVVDRFGVEAEDLCCKAPWGPAEPEILWLALRPHRRRLTRAPLPFIKAISQYLLNSMTTPGITKKQAGDALELLVSYLFAAEPGFEMLGSSLAPDAQHDVLVRNSHLDTAVAAMGAYFLIECKNWSNKIRAPVIREFAGRLHSTGVKTGIIVARSGISGARKKATRAGARLTISKEYIQDHTTILVLDKSGLDELVSGEVSLPAVLLSLFEDVRFDRL